MPSKHPHRSTTHKERFIHLRDLKHEKYSNATIFARQEEDGRWYGSLSLCWRLDQFDKAKGRSLSHRHYFEGKRVVIPSFPYDDKIRNNIIINTVLEQNNIV